MVLAEMDFTGASRYTQPVQDDELRTCIFKRIRHEHADTRRAY
jgi:phosphoenolpyruvate carboxylase